MPGRRVTFANDSGQQLAALLDAPKQPRSFALFAHCFACGKDVRAAYYISKELASHGIATLRFDFTGLGDSEGSFAQTSFSSNVADLVAAADWLAREHGAPALLIGHSLGGAAMLRAVKQIRSAKAVVTIAAPSDPAHVLKLLAGVRETLKREGEATVKLAGKRVRVGQQFVEDVSEGKLTAAIRSLRRALLVAHAPGDKVVGIEHAQRIYEAALHPKSFISLSGASHLLSEEADAKWLARVIAAWAERYVEVDKAKG